MTALLAILLLAGQPELKPGKVVRRLSGFRSVQYAVYLPPSYKKKPLPFVMHIPMTLFAPEAYLRHFIVDRTLGGEPRFDTRATIHCAISLQAHNRYEQRANPKFDVEDYNRLSDIDAKAVARILDALQEELAIRSGAVLITGGRQAAQAALAVGTRLPDRFCAILCTNGELTGFTWPKDKPKERVLAVLKKVPDMPIALAYTLYRSKGTTMREIAEEWAAPALKRMGFLRVTMLPGARTAHVAQWFEGVWKRREAGRRARTERDQLLQQETKHLWQGLKNYRAARKLEVEHRLDPASEVLYRSLEKRGEAMLAEGRTREVARLFKGLPLGAKADKLLRKG